jgi:hypothetical protein
LEVDMPLLDRVHEVSGGDLVVSERTRILLPEVSIQAQASFGDLRPYVVAGVGMAVPLRGFRGDDGGRCTPDWGRESSSGGVR